MLYNFLLGFKRHARKNGREDSKKRIQPWSAVVQQCASESLIQEFSRPAVKGVSLVASGVTAFFMMKTYSVTKAGSARLQVGDRCTGLYSVWPVTS
jgi:hypothetical protein